MEIFRLPRKTKKDLKKLYEHRYGCKWLKCDSILVEYKWFYENPYRWHMNEKLN